LRFHGGVQEAQVEERVVPDQDGPAAVVLLHRPPDLAEDPLQGVPLGDRGPQGMVGVDAVDLERRCLHVRSLERLHVVAVAFAGHHRAVGLHLHEHRRDLEQGVGRGIESPGLHVHHHGQEPAEAPGHERGGLLLVVE